MKFSDFGEACWCLGLRRVSRLVCRSDPAHCPSGLWAKNGFHIFKWLEKNSTACENHMQFQSCSLRPGVCSLLQTVGWLPLGRRACRTKVVIFWRISERWPVLCGFKMNWLHFFGKQLLLCVHVDLCHRTFIVLLGWVSVRVLHGEAPAGRGGAERV